MRFKKHTVTYGDTMQSISQRYFNDTSYWIDLIEHNNLKYPYIVDNEEEKLKDTYHLVTIGDTIIIPTEEHLSDVAIKEISKKDRDTLVELALGRDLNITEDEKYFNEHGTSDEILGFNGDKSGDLDTLVAIENMKQQLQTKLLTPKGSLMLHPDYGSEIHNLFGKAIPEQGVLIELEVIRTLMTDTRVKAVNSLGWKINGNQYYGRFEVEIQSIEESVIFTLEQDETGIFAIFE